MMSSYKQNGQFVGLMYTRARQAAITQEITEVCAGAKSLKKE